MTSDRRYYARSRWFDRQAHRRLPYGNVMRRVAILFLLGCIAGAVQAQSPTPTVTPPAPSTGIHTAPVIVNGEELFKVVGIESYPAARRARETAKRITALARDPTFDRKMLTLKEEKGRTGIFARDKLIYVVFEADSAQAGLAAQTHDLAETYRILIGDVIERYREERTPKALLYKTAHTVAVVLIYALLLLGTLWGFRKLFSLLELRVKRKFQELEAKSQRIFQAEQIWLLLRGLLRFLRGVIVLFLTYVFLNTLFAIFPWTRAIGRTMLRFLVDPLVNVGEAVINYIPSLIYLVILILIARSLLRATRTFFSAVEKGRMRLPNFEPEWSQPTLRIVRFVIIALVVVLAYPYIPGSQSDAFKGVSIFLGVLFSLGSTSMISNVIAGYTMTYRRAFRVGDRVRIGNTTGDVTEMRLMVTHVRSLKNEEVVIPNSNIINSEVINYTTLAGTAGLILHTQVGIGYETPWRQVEAMLMMAAERTPGLLKEPKPFVLQMGLADYAVNYELNVYCDDAKKMVLLYTELHGNIQDVFNEYGVQIMTPSYRADPAEPKIVPKKNWFTSPAKPPETGST